MLKFSYKALFCCFISFHIFGMNQPDLQKFGYTGPRLKKIQKKLGKLRKSKTDKISKIEHDLEKLNPEEFHSFYEEFKSQQVQRPLDSKFQQKLHDFDQLTDNDFKSIDQEFHLLTEHFELKEIRAVLKKIITLNEQALDLLKYSLCKNEQNFAKLRTTSPAAVLVANALELKVQVSSLDMEEKLPKRKKILNKTQPDKTDLSIELTWVKYLNKSKEEVTKENLFKSNLRSLFREAVIEPLKKGTKFSIIIESLEKILSNHGSLYQKAKSSAFKALMDEFIGFTIYTVILFRDLSILPDSYNFIYDPNNLSQIENTLETIQLLLSSYFLIEKVSHEKQEVSLLNESLNKKIPWQVCLYKFLKDLAMDKASFCC